MQHRPIPTSKYGTVQLRTLCFYLKNYNQLDKKFLNFLWNLKILYRV